MGKASRAKAERKATIITYMPVSQPDWTSFKEMPVIVTPKAIENLMKDQQCSEELARARLESERVWLNSRYQVHITQELVFEADWEITHLSIKRVDKMAIHDWRDLQRIKNELCGPEREAVEIYPAEKRLVDEANQFHLWVFPEGMGVPFGFVERRVRDGHWQKQPQPDVAMQRPFEKG